MSATAPGRTGTSRGPRGASGWAFFGAKQPPIAGSDGDGSRSEGRSATLETMFGAIIHVVTLPFRGLALAIEWMGRLASLLLGFLLMVVGAALLAGPLTLIGVPMFLFGLFLTLRALG